MKLTNLALTIGLLATTVYSLALPDRPTRVRIVHSTTTVHTTTTLPPTPPPDWRPNNLIEDIYSHHRPVDGEELRNTTINQSDLLWDSTGFFKLPGLNVDPKAKFPPTGWNKFQATKSLSRANPCTFLEVLANNPGFQLLDNPGEFAIKPIPAEHIDCSRVPGGEWLLGAIYWGEWWNTWAPLESEYNRLARAERIAKIAANDVSETGAVRNDTAPYGTGKPPGFGSGPRLKVPGVKRPRPLVSGVGWRVETDHKQDINGEVEEDRIEVDIEMPSETAVEAPVSTPVLVTAPPVVAPVVTQAVAVQPAAIQPIQQVPVQPAATLPPVIKPVQIANGFRPATEPVFYRPPGFRDHIPVGDKIGYIPTVEVKKDWETPRQPAAARAGPKGSISSTELLKGMHSTKERPYGY